MDEHVILVAFTVDADTREQAHEALLPHLVPLLHSHDTTSPIDSWWVAEDDRTDGSDCDSAVFVTPGNQPAALALLRQHHLTPGHNLPTTTED